MSVSRACDAKERPDSDGDTTGHLDLRLMVVFYDAFRRDLAHLPRAASHRPAELDELARRTAVLAGWELFKTQLHIHHTALEAL